MSPYNLRYQNSWSWPHKLRSGDSCSPSFYLKRELDEKTTLPCFYLGRFSTPRVIESVSSSMFHAKRLISPSTAAVMRIDDRLFKRTFYTCSIYIGNTPRKTLDSGKFELQLWFLQLRPRTISGTDWPYCPHESQILRVRLKVSIPHPSVSTLRSCAIPIRYAESDDVMHRTISSVCSALIRFCQCHRDSVQRRHSQQHHVEIERTRSLCNYHTHEKSCLCFANRTPRAFRAREFGREHHSRRWTPQVQASIRGRKEDKRVTICDKKNRRSGLILNTCRGCIGKMRSS